MSRITLSLLSLALVSLAACGSDNGPMEPTSVAPAGDVPFHVRIDVRDNLLRYYDTAAARPAPRTTEVHLDFRETSRAQISETEARVEGEFLFSVDNSPLRRGRIDVRFTWRNDRWIRTGFTVTEASVGSHRIALRISDSLTDEPLIGVAVEAWRVDDADLSSHPGYTDAAGFVELEVFPGVFQVRAQRSAYRPTLTDFIPVPDEESEVRLSLHKLDATVW